MLRISLLLSFCCLTRGAPVSQKAEGMLSKVLGSPGSIVVLGAKGPTGSRIVNQLREEGHKVVAASRSVPKDSVDEAGVTWVHGDVRDASSLIQLLKSTSAVVMAASASQGWRLFGNNTPKLVDFEGVRNVADAAVKQQVPRVIVISSAFVTRPYHPIAMLLTTLAGRIMHWKRQGELALIEACNGTSTSYTIIRPGGLTNAQGKGLEAVSIGQGDTLSGRISRDDVAAVTVAALKDGNTKNTVFEIVEKKEGKASCSIHGGFRSLRSNDGSHDPLFYHAEAKPTKGSEL